MKREVRTIYILNQPLWKQWCAVPVYLFSPFGGLLQRFKKQHRGGWQAVSVSINIRRNISLPEQNKLA